MKKTISILLVLLITFSITSYGYCDGPIRKLGRGISNILTCPLEIPNRMKETNKRAGPYEAATYGFLEGVCMMGLRVAAGTFEIATFPFPIPEGYKPILDDPEFLVNLDKAKKEKTFDK